MTSPARVYYPSARAVINVRMGFKDDEQESAVIWTIPKSATVHRNRASEADSFELTFDERDCPVDPAFILAAEVSIYLYNSPAFLEQDRLFDRSKLIGNKTEGDRQDQLERRRQEFTFQSEPTIVGLIDEIRRELGEGGRWITLQGQDYTALFLQKQWPPVSGTTPRRIPTGRRLDVVIQEMLSEVDPSGTLTLELRDLNASDLPIVKDDGINRGKFGIPVESDTKYWDVMHKTVERSGFKLYIEGLRVVIEHPRTELPQDSRRKFSLAWGENIESLSVSRHLGIQKRPAILMCGYDPKTRKRIEVIYPEGAKLKTTINSGKAGTHKSTTKIKPTVQSKKGHKDKAVSIVEENEYLVVPAPDGVSDVNALKRAAQSRYADIGRAERAITLATHDLVDLTEQSLLDLRSGDVVQVTFDDYNRETLASEQLSEAEKFQILVDRGFSADAASAIVTHYTQLQAYDRPLFLREVSFNYDNESGLAVELELADFIVFDGSVADSDRRNADGKRLGIGTTKAHEHAALAGAR